MTFQLYTVSAIAIALIGGWIWIVSDDDSFCYATILIELVLAALYVLVGH